MWPESHHSWALSNGMVWIIIIPLSGTVTVDQWLVCDHSADTSFQETYPQSSLVAVAKWIRPTVSGSLICRLCQTSEQYPDSAYWWIFCSEMLFTCERYYFEISTLQVLHNFTGNGLLCHVWISLIMSPIPCIPTPMLQQELCLHSLIVQRHKYQIYEPNNFALMFIINSCFFTFHLVKNFNILLKWFHLYLFP